MHIVINAALVYFFLMIILRVSGRRTMAHLSSFDFVLLLIISELVQGVLIGDDPSLTTAIIAITTLITLDVLLSLVKRHFPVVDRVIEGVPLVIVRQGQLMQDYARRARVDLNDVLMVARESQGLASLDEIEYAILETNGKISIIPRAK